MAYQKSKWKSYTLPSVEGIHILRDPPKSVHTRKYEPVHEADVLYMIRNDDSRINEGVSYLARGVNNHVDVSYNNVGGGSRLTSMPNVQASNPYKVMKSGAFRPPLYKLTDREPLSRQRYDETAAITNPGVPGGFSVYNLTELIDKTPIQNAISKATTNYLSVEPTVSYKVQIPQQVFVNNAIHDNPLQVAAKSAIAGPGDYTTSRTMARNVPSAATRSALGANAMTNLVGLQDFNAAREAANHTSTAIQDALHTAAGSNIKGQSDFSAAREMISNDPNEVNDNNMHYAVGATANNPLADIERTETISEENYIKDNLILKNIAPNFSISIYDPQTKNFSDVYASTKDKLNIAVQANINAPINLKREDGTVAKLKEYRYSIVNSAVGIDHLVLQPINAPDLQLERNTPLYAVGSNISGYTKDQFSDVTPIMAEKVTTAAQSAQRLQGRNEGQFDYSNNVNLRGTDNYGAVTSSARFQSGRQATMHDYNYQPTVKGMGSVGFTTQGFGASMPVNQERNIPTFQRSTAKMQAGSERFMRA